MIKIHEGYIIKPRKIMKSDIWQKKPAWWLKVWDYLIIKVNHKDNEYFPRGTNFFTYEMIHHDCKLSNDRVKKHSLDNLVRWLKRVGNITTRKTTRGFIVTICNYETYQNPDNYKNDTVNDSQNETQTKHKRNTNDTINNNETMKECNNVKPLSVKKKQTVPEVKLFIDAWFIAYLKKFGEKYNVSGGKEGMLVKSMISKYGFDKLKTLANDFWTSIDPFIISSGYTIGTFHSQINKLNANKNNPDTRLTKAQLQTKKNWEAWQDEEINA